MLSRMNPSSAQVRESPAEGMWGGWFFFVPEFTRMIWPKQKSLMKRDPFPAALLQMPEINCPGAKGQVPGKNAWQIAP